MLFEWQQKTNGITFRHMLEVPQREVEQVVLHVIP